MKNKELFQRDPTTFSIPNDGVTTVTYPQTDEQWDVLKYELQSFVCEGQYRAGLERILSTYLAQLGQNKQPAVWVSGFYGSGKSHLVRMLEHYWRNLRLPDGSEARELSTLPVEIDTLLRELTTEGTRRGGLWAAAGRLNSGASSIRLDILSIVLRSAGLPTKYAPARFVLWLQRQRLYEAVRDQVAAAGASFEQELDDMYVSPVLANSLLAVMPDFAADQKEARKLLSAQYPDKPEITNDELVKTVHLVLEQASDKPNELPCALLILDEMQQAIGDDANRALEVQAVVEDLASEFGARLLVVGTGQSGIQGNAQLQKLQGRFTVRVELSDRDVEQVVREVVLRKNPTHVPALEVVLDQVSGEIDRHLGGTRIAPKAEDRSDLVPDYPLLPTRRRFWEQVLRAIDTGTAAQLRTQLHTVHKAAQSVANREVGTVVGGDFVFGEQKAAMLQSSVLLPDLAAIIDQQDDGTNNGRLRSRLCATIFLIGKLPTSGAAVTGLRADANTLADLLVQDLPRGSSDLRGVVPQLLEEMADKGILMAVEGEYRLQTRESAEWQSDYKQQFARLRAEPTRIASDRDAALREAVGKAFKNIKLLHGVNKTPRELSLHFGLEAPPTNTTTVPVWMRDEWAVTEKTVRTDAQTAGTNDPTVYLLLPRLDAQALTDALAGRAAADAVLNSRPSHQATDEGREARKAMETQRDRHAAQVEEIVAAILRDARVWQGGGNELTEASTVASVERAAKNALVRLFPEFPVTDIPGWGQVVKRAGEGNAEALEAVGHTTNPADHPAVKAVLAKISASGTRGNEIQSLFMGPGYGWPKDAVDGILLTLLSAGLVNARDKSAQPVTAKQLPQSQIGVTTFRGEEYILSATQRIALRKLIKDLGVDSKSGEEAAGIQQALANLRALAGQASGEPPLPAKPDTSHLEVLQTLAGNEQLVRALEQQELLRANYVAWKAMHERRDNRLDRWRRLAELSKHARDLPVAAEVEAQRQAILQQRSLLQEMDPVKPLLDTLTDALRQAAQQARQAVVDTRDRELKAIEDTAEWQQPGSSEVWKPILQAHKLGPVDPLDVSTDEKLLESLNSKPLASWAMEVEAIPTRIEEARQEVALQFAPEAVRVLPKPDLLNTEADVEAYIADLKAEIMRHIADGNPVII